MMELSPAKRALLEKWLRGQTNEDANSIGQRPPNSPIPLSFPQQRQLFLEMLERGTAVNNLSVFLELRGRLDPVALEQSTHQIIARHDALRTRFSFGTGVPAPEILEDVKIHLSSTDLRQIGAANQADAARRMAEQAVLQPFDLTQAPLIRLQLYILSEEVHRLLVVVHHTIADGWSLGVFLRELLARYQAITLNAPLQLPELPVQYADFAYWQNSQKHHHRLQSSIDYWKKQLAGELPVLELPTDRQRGARQSFSGGSDRFTLSPALTEALEKFSRQEDVTVFMTLLTAFYTLLHRYSGQDDILVGTPVANRNAPELEHLIGVFINTLVLRADLSGAPSFRELIRRVRDMSLEAYAHQYLPFEQLVEALRPKRDLSRTPLFQVVFNLQNSPLPQLEMPGLDLCFLDLHRGVSQFDLTLMMSRSGGQYCGTVEFKDDLFEPATIARMFQSFQMLLEYAIVQPDCPVSRLPLVGQAELDRLVRERNRTSVEYPRERNVHHLFEAQVERTPDALAVMYQDDTLTYTELNRRANAWARHIQAMGIGPGARIGVLMKRSLEMVEALLAILKAGCVYVPMHSSFPPERVNYILKDADIQVLLTNIDQGPFEKTPLTVIHLDKEKPFISDDTSNPGGILPSGALAYAIYTSGSTGRPKGVAIPHSALTNFLWSMRSEPGIKGGDVLLAVTSISFDIAALELYLPLIEGATVVIASEEMMVNPVLLGQAIQRYRVNIMQATPAIWQLLLESGWAGESRLKALCGGDVLSRKLADQLLERVGCLWNMYGPTETTIWSSISQVQPGNAPITIGNPIANTQMYILDAWLHPMPVGVVGELYIGGEGLAEGYLHQPQLTSEKFIPDCFSRRPGARLYKTGDHARYLPDYSIELLGRMDDQVKVNGNRIELGEVTAVLMQHPAVQGAVAIAHTEHSGDKRLVAYYVPKLDQQPEIASLQDFLRKKLPSYMMPAVFICLETLPLTPSGKIDRKSLPEPVDARQLPGYVAPRNKEEQILASIWQDVLGITKVGVYDNFFDLGGASIQSIQVVAKANISGLRLQVEHIFEYQTIAGLAAYLNAHA